MLIVPEDTIYKCAWRNVADRARERERGRAVVHIRFRGRDYTECASCFHVKNDDRV